MERDAEFLTANEVAELLGISRSMIASWADEGRIPFSLTAKGERLFRRADIEAVVVRIDDEPEEPHPPEGAPG